jgi:hypothetical protein
MNWNAIAAIATVASATGVLLSVLYLAAQVRKNTEESRIARGQHLVTGVSDVSALIATNLELSKIVRAGMLDYEALNEIEKFRFSFLFFSFMAKYDFSYHQKIAGRIDDVLWGQTTYEISTFLKLPGANQWWEKDKARFTPGFRQFVDASLASVRRPAEVPGFGNVAGESDAT